MAKVRWCYVNVGVGVVVMVVLVVVSAFSGWILSLIGEKLVAKVRWW